ncbi:MAG TPA: hypothetical protein ENH82_15795 [bacterium]|nr:hypothetical protein [bacterium]
MKTKLVISATNLQTKSPIGSTLLLYLLFEKWNTPMWVYGAVGTLLILWFAAWIVDIVKSKAVDVFEELRKKKES